MNQMFFGRAMQRKPALVSQLVAILSLAIASLSVQAAGLKLASPFSDHMVLQRDVPLRISGTAEKGATVEVAIGTQRQTTQAGDDGKWAIALAPMSAGGPFSLTASSANDTVRLRDVLVGDVWLCSGQSNMQLPVAETDGGQQAVANAGKLKNVRLLLLPKTPAQQPIETFDARWRAASPESAATFSGVGFYFARALRDDSALDGVPIGLVDNSFGGTAAEAWISSDTLASKFSPGDLLDSIFGIKPAQLFNGMVAPITKLNVKGVLWYQGESNTAKPGLYKQMLSTMIQEWRDKWQSPDLPFLIVQLPNYPGNVGMDSFTWIREAQAQVVKSVKTTWMATIIDTPDGFELHPKQKRMVGERLALLARKNVYGESVLSAGPVFTGVTKEGCGRLRVLFDLSGSALVNRHAPGELRGFMLAGDDRAYHFARATIDGDSVILSSEAVLHPLAVRYAWLTYPDADLCNTAGLPAAPFRTDDFPIEKSIEVQRLQPPWRVATGSYEAVVDGAGIFASLMIQGHQILSNEGSGGLTVDGLFLPRSLYYVTERSPDEIEFTDKAIAVEYSFGVDAITITIRNNTTADATGRLHLCSEMALSAGGTAGSFVARRDGIAAMISGVDSLEVQPNGAHLMLKVPAMSSKIIHIQISGAAKTAN
jgi:sialate O-acetylesterase